MFVSDPKVSEEEPVETNSRFPDGWMKSGGTRSRRLVRATRLLNLIEIVRHYISGKPDAYAAKSGVPSRES